eukprot:SAG11_NODE_8836_length_971_cov_1.530963_2_plen_84_part_00
MSMDYHVLEYKLDGDNLSRGATATVARAGVLSAFQMGVASEAKQQLPVLAPAVFSGDRPETAVLLMCTSVVSGSLVAVAVRRL